MNFSIGNCPVYLHFLESSNRSIFCLGVRGRSRHRTGSVPEPEQRARVAAAAQAARVPRRALPVAHAPLAPALRAAADPAARQGGLGSSSGVSR